MKSGVSDTYLSFIFENYFSDWSIPFLTWCNKSDKFKLFHNLFSISSKHFGTSKSINTNKTDSNKLLSARTGTCQVKSESIIIIKCILFIFLLPPLIKNIYFNLCSWSRNIYVFSYRGKPGKTTIFVKPNLRLKSTPV